MVEIKQVSKSYGDLLVLNDVSYSFIEGKTTVIIGSSGSGKSTILRCINKLERHEKGQILFNNKNIDKYKNSDLMCDIGMVFQQFNLFSNMTVLNNVTYALIKVKKIPKETAISKAKIALQRVNMIDKIDSYPNTLSGGQKQRVALARALVMEPKVMLFDEPTSALDPEMVNEILEEIKKLTKTGLTNIIVTHEMGFAKEVADEIIFIDEGKIIESGSAVSFFENPKNKRTKEFLNKIL